ncbi:MAG: mechanosensitive ion channel family protein, partial [Candidatus Kapaibacterium sp.]
SGRIVDVPNGRVFTMPQYNYSKQFPLLWNELSFRTTFESDIESVKSIIKIALDLPEIQNSKDDIAKLNDVIENFITYNISADTAIFFKVVENGYQFTFRYLCKFNGRRKTEQIIWESIIKSVNENPNVRFAYPTQRFVSGIDNKIQGQNSYNIV